MISNSVTVSGFAREFYLSSLQTDWLLTLPMSANMDRSSSKLSGRTSSETTRSLYQQSRASVFNIVIATRRRGVGQYEESGTVRTLASAAADQTSEAAKGSFGPLRGQ